MPEKESIKWTLIEVKASDLKPNKHNPKERNKRGFERLQKSINTFGRVFDGIVNTDLSIIDGHSRLETAEPEAMLKVFKPSRKLSQREYKEMNAIFDQAKAGDFDTDIAFEQLGEEFLKDWDLDFKPSGVGQEGRFDDEGIVDDSQFAVIVHCKDEAEQEKLFNEFESKGLNCKVVMV